MQGFGSRVWQSIPHLCFGMPFMSFIWIIMHLWTSLWTIHKVWSMVMEAVELVRCSKIPKFGFTDLSNERRFFKATVSNYMKGGLCGNGLSLLKQQNWLKINLTQRQFQILNNNRGILAEQQVRSVTVMVPTVFGLTSTISIEQWNAW